MGLEMDASDQVTLGIVAARIEGIREDISHLRTDVRENVVSRREWEERNKSIDREMMDIKARRAPWWATVTAIAAVGSICWSVVLTVVG